MPAIAQEAEEFRAPPPRRLRPVQDIRWAKHSRTIPDFAKRPVVNDTEPRKAGRRYENKVQEYLLQRHPRYYIASPWYVLRMLPVLAFNLGVSLMGGLSTSTEDSLLLSR